EGRWRYLKPCQQAIQTDSGSVLAYGHAALISSTIAGHLSERGEESADDFYHEAVRLSGEGLERAPEDALSLEVLARSHLNLGIVAPDAETVGKHLGAALEAASRGREARPTWRSGRLLLAEIWFANAIRAVRFGSQAEPMLDNALEELAPLVRGDDASELALRYAIDLEVARADVRAMRGLDPRASLSKASELLERTRGAGGAGSSAPSWEELSHCFSVLSLRVQGLADPEAVRLSANRCEELVNSGAGDPSEAETAEDAAWILLQRLRAGLVAEEEIASAVDHARRQLAAGLDLRGGSEAYWALGMLERWIALRADGAARGKGLEAAAENIRLAQEGEPSLAGQLELAEALFLLAEHRRRRGDLEKARVVFEEARGLLRTAREADQGRPRHLSSRLLDLVEPHLAARHGLADGPAPVDWSDLEAVEVARRDLRRWWRFLAEDSPPGHEIGPLPSGLEPAHQVDGDLEDPQRGPNESA
ncbi:MAG: hypothetical protein AAF725_15000, partial [Acidobacteriota bacterium]